MVSVPILLPKMRKRLLLIITFMATSMIYCNAAHACTERRIIDSPEEQIFSCSKKIQKKPKAKWYYIRGLAKMKTEKSYSALNDFSNAIKIEPNKAIYYINRSKAYARMQNIEKAYDDAKHAVKLEPENADAIVQLGAATWLFGNPKEALEILTKAISIDSGNIDAYIQRGRLYAYSSKVQALNDLTKAVNLDPQNQLARTSLDSLVSSIISSGDKYSYDNIPDKISQGDYSNWGFAYLILKQYQKAVKHLNKSIRIKGNVFDYTNRAQAYLSMGDSRSAIKDYTEIIRIDNANTDVYLRRAKAYIEDKQFDSALADIERRLDYFPDDRRAKYMKAEALAMGDKVDMAIAEMDSMVEDSPNDYIVYDLRAKFYETIDQPEKAKTNREISKKLFTKRSGQNIIRTYEEPSWVPGDNYEDIEKIAQMPLQEVLSLSGKLIKAEYYSKAIKVLTKAAEHNPDSSLIYYLRGKAHIASNKSEKAILDFEKSIASDNSFVWAYFERGKTNLKKRHYQKAEDDFDKAIEMDPTIAQFHYYKGLALEKSGKEKEQLGAYNAAIEINPEYEEAFFSRAWWYRVRGKYTLALSDLNKVLHINPFNHGAKFYRAITLMKMGKTDEAIDGFKMAINQSPNDNLSYMWLGQIQAGKGDFDNAISSFSKCLDILSTSYICMSERGEIYYKTGHYEKAILDFDQYLHTYPDDSSILAMRAKALSSLNPEKTPAMVMLESVKPTIENYHAYYMAVINSGDANMLKTAAELLNKVTVINPGDKFAFYMLGTVYHEMGDAENAALALEAGLKNMPRFGSKHKTYLAGKYYTDKLKMATEEIEKVESFKKVPGFEIRLVASKYSKRAYVYMDMGQFENAVKDLSKALEFDQDVDFWLFKRAESYFELGKYKKALKDIDKSISLSTGSQIVSASNGSQITKTSDINHIYLILRGRIYQRKKMYAESLDDFNRAIKVFPEGYHGPEVFYSRGVARTSVQRYSEAYEDFIKAYYDLGYRPNLL